MGRVYRALDPAVEREVAVKQMAPLELFEPAERGEVRERFLREARAAGRLHHPGIVMVLDAGADAEGRLPYIVMELVEGRSLAGLLQPGVPLAVAVVIDIGIEVARALGYAHRQGVVHRDVKPANILIADDGRIKVSDFGVAKLASQSLTLTGKIVGSPYFMAPEQVRGEPVDGRADLFALGAVLYQCVTGQRSFPGSTIAEVTYKVIHTDPRPVREWSPGCPAALEAVIVRALSKHPDDRFETGEEMAEALEGAAPEGGLTGTRWVVPAAWRGEQTGAETVVLSRFPPRDGSAVAAAPPASPGRRRPLLRWGVPGLLALGLLGLVLGLQGPGRPAEPVVADEPSAQEEPAAREPAEVPAPVPPAGSPSEAAPAVVDPAPAAPAATLTWSFRNRLRTGSLTVWVDGRPVLSRRLDRPGNFFKQVTGQRLEGSIPVTAGERTIEVRLEGRPPRVDARESTRATFEAGERRRLQVVLNPATRNLRLSWGDPRG
jgi:serine/threonine-protein kinase